MYLTNCLMLKDPNGKVGITQVMGLCPFCGKQWKLCVLTNSLEAYAKGELIQKAFPGLSTQSRELLQSGVCEICWEKEITGC